MLSYEQACQELAPGSTVLLRVDFNLSRDSQGEWILNERFFRMIPVIKQLLAMQFAVVLVSHLGAPPCWCLGRKVFSVQLKCAIGETVSSAGYFFIILALPTNLFGCWYCCAC